MHLEGAKSLGEYAEDFYAGMPAVTENCYGNGKVYYIGTLLEESARGKLFSYICGNAQIKGLAETAPGLEITCRETETHKIYFALNFGDEECRLPEMFWGQKDLLTGSVLAEDTVLKKFDVCIVQVEK